MRYQPWRQTLHLRVPRTSMKYSKSFSINSTFSRFYNAAKQKSLEARKHQLEKRKTYASENRIIKRTTEERDKKEKIHAFVELRRQYEALRAEQMNLERQIKKRTTILIKAVYRHRKSTKKLGDIERTLINYSEQLKQTLSNNIISATSGHRLNDSIREANYNNLNIPRTMGGRESFNEYAEFMPSLVKKFTTVRKYADRWMQKANIKSKSVMDMATIIKKQRLSWEPYHEIVVMPKRGSVKPLLPEVQHERETGLTSPSSISVYSIRNELKKPGSAKSMLVASEVVRTSADSSRLSKRRKKLKVKQSATSDIDEPPRRQRTGKRRDRRGRRSSGKSQQSNTSDGVKNGKKKRKGRRKSIKSLDSTGQNVRQRARKGRKRRTKEKSRLSALKQPSVRPVSILKSHADENVNNQANLQEQMKEGVTDKFKRVEIAAIHSDTYNQFNALEEYWGVSLREDSTLQKLELLNSVLDELIVEEEQKPRPLRSLARPKSVYSARKVIPKSSKCEMHDLEKLLILLKECKKCQKDQEKMKTAEQDCTVLCQKEYYDAIRNAAGLPDYFPEDSDFSVICSCNSLT